MYRPPPSSTGSRRKLRVAQCIHGLGLGGAQQILRHIVAGADPEEFEFIVYCCRNGVLRGPVEEAGATVRRIRRWLPKFDPVWMLSLARGFRRDRIDVVHGHLFGDTLHGYLAAKLNRTLPFVMTLHSAVENFSPAQRLAYRWLLAGSTRPIACSETARNSFLATGWPGSAAITAIANGIVDPGPPPTDEPARRKLREELGVDPDSVVIATIGRLAEEKGYSYVIDAFSRLSRTGPGSRLVLIGDGELLASLEKRARAAGIEHLVVFAGYRSDVETLLPALDVVVFSSLYEGLSVALLEAMASSRCIVATQVEGIGTVVRDGREALLFPPRDVDALHRLLQTAVASSSLRAELGCAARRRFVEGFTADRMVRQYEAVYRQLARGDGRQGPRSSTS